MNELTWSKLKESVNQKDMTILENASYTKSYDQRIVILKEKIEKTKIEIEEFQQKNKRLQNSIQLLKNLNESDVQNIPLQNQLHKGQKERIKHEEKAIEDLRQYSKNLLDNLEADYNSIEKQYQENVPEYQELKNVLRESKICQLKYKLLQHGNKEEHEQQKLYRELKQKQFNNIIINFVKKIIYRQDNINVVKNIEEFTRKGNILLRVYEEKLDKEKIIMSNGRENIHDIMQYLKENPTPMKVMNNISSFIKPTTPSPSIISLMNKKKYSISPQERQRLLERAKEREEIRKRIHSTRNVEQKLVQPTIEQNINKFEYPKNINKLQTPSSKNIQYKLNQVKPSYEQNREKQISKTLTQLQNKFPSMQKMGYLNKSDSDKSHKESLNSEMLKLGLNLANNLNKPNIVNTSDLNDQKLHEKSFFKNTPPSLGNDQMIQNKFSQMFNKSSQESMLSQGEQMQNDFSDMFNKHSQELKSSQEKRFSANEEIQGQFKVPTLQEKKTIPKTPKKIISHTPMVNPQTPIKAPLCKDNKINILNQMTMKSTDFGLKRKASDLNENVTNKAVRFQDINTDDSFKDNTFEDSQPFLCFSENLNNQSEELPDLNYSDELFKMGSQMMEGVNTSDDFNKELTEMQSNFFPETSNVFSFN